MGFISDDYKLIKNNTKLLKGHYDVFDDKSIVIISTPGHTLGHQSLYIDLPYTGIILLSGDLYHFLDNRINYGIPVFNATKRETIHSFDKLNNLS